METVKSPAINDNNGQLCRQTQGKCWDSTNIYLKVKYFLDTQKRGKVIVSCLVVLIASVIGYLIFSVVDYSKHDLHKIPEQIQQNYEYFKIKQWP